MYFGKKAEVTRREAEQLFAEHLQTITTETKTQRQLRISRACSVWELCDKHNLWIKANRANGTFNHRRSLLQAFCNHIVGKEFYGGGYQIGDLAADRVNLDHAKEFLDGILDDTTRQGYVVAIKAAFNWAATPKHADGGGLLPENVRPFAYLKRVKLPPKDLTEADLITVQEYELLIKYADYDTGKVRADTGRWRKRNADEHRKGIENPYTVFKDLLKVMYATGPRTSEPLNCTVRDFHRRTKQLTLGKHKRVRTQRNTTLRQMALSGEAFQIVLDYTKCKEADKPIFPNADGNHWTQDRFNERFREVKAIISEKYEAGDESTCIRDFITPYAFRDLYISELLMIGTPVFQVAKMAGTSVTEIERTYGHFFNAQHLEAQERLETVRLEARQNRLKSK
jgi:integrase